MRVIVIVKESSHKVSYPQIKAKPSSADTGRNFYPSDQCERRTFQEIEIVLHGIPVKKIFLYTGVCEESLSSLSHISIC